MKSRLESHLFWGPHSPLSALGGAGLIIMASGRVSFALISGITLIWVYGLSALVYSGSRPILPVRGRMIVLLFLSTFLCGIFLFLLSLLNPLLVIGMEFFLLLIPVCCLGSGLFNGTESVYPGELVTRALLEAVVLAVIILAFALLREPLGMGTLSLPGGVQGIVELFSPDDDGGFIPVRILSASAGGLLLLGFGISLFRYFRERSGGTMEENQ